MNIKQLTDAKKKIRSFASRAKKASFSYFRHPPDFLIIGTQKSGTTSLHAYLKEHPQILAPSGDKEIHFFNIYYYRGFNWYLSQFPWRFQTRGRLTFEATPDYISHHKAPLRIKKDLGNIKLILTLREPVARAYSAWKMWNSFIDHDEKAAKADRRSFSEAIKQELSSPDEQSELHFHYLAKGRYVEQIENFYKYFPDNKLLILDYQKMNNDLYCYLSQICDFLEIDHFSKDETRQFKKKRLWVSPKRKTTSEDNATMKVLHNYYKPYNEKLYSLLGRRLNW